MLIHSLGRYVVGSGVGAFVGEPFVGALVVGLVGCVGAFVPAFGAAVGALDVEIFLGPAALIGSAVRRVYWLPANWGGSVHHMVKLLFTSR